MYFLCFNVLLVLLLLDSKCDFDCSLCTTRCELYIAIKLGSYKVKNKPESLKKTNRFAFRMEWTKTPPKNRKCPSLYIDCITVNCLRLWYFEIFRFWNKPAVHSVCRLDFEAFALNSKWDSPKLILGFCLFCILKFSHLTESADLKEKCIQQLLLCCNADKNCQPWMSNRWKIWWWNYYQQKKPRFDVTNNK